MKRIDIHYGGGQYSVGGREVADLRREVAEAVGSGHGWLEVNDGEGDVRTAFLLLAPGVPVALVPIPDELPVAAVPPIAASTGEA